MCLCVLVNYVCYNVKAVHMSVVCLHAACTCSSVLVMRASRQAVSKADYVESVCITLCTILCISFLYVCLYLCFLAASL